MSQPEIAGQLSSGERQLLSDVLTSKQNGWSPKCAIEVGTWLGGGSTLHILRALHQNQEGHLWGVEYSREIYDKMIANLRSAIPEALDRFTPLFGKSEEVIPNWLKTLPEGTAVDFAFLDGGDSPSEQVSEFQLLDSHMPVGSHLMAHDARARKGKWFVPYILELDHWKAEVLDLSEVGLLKAVKVSLEPTKASRDAAERTLQRLRREPKELIARLLPQGVRSMVARILPSRFLHRILHGKAQ